MTESKKKILFIVAHPDDAELMFGGTINKYIELGHEVNIIIVTDGSLWARIPITNQKDLIKMRKEEAKKSSQVLKINKTIFLGMKDGKIRTEELILSLLATIRKINPNIIITHDPEEGHYDHKNLSKAVFRLCNREEEPAPIMNCLYDNKKPIASNFEGLITYWPIKKGLPKDVKFIKLSKTNIEKKIEAVKCYNSQFPGKEAQKMAERVTTEAKFLGNLSYNQYAEIYKVIKNGNEVTELFEL